MAFSVFFEYQASFPSTDLEHIFGADSQANGLIDTLSNSDFKLIENDLWRDFGWYIIVMNSGVALSIFMAKYGANEKWQLTIEPDVKVSLFGRFLGRKEQPFKGSLRKLCILVEQYLLSADVKANELEVCFSKEVKRTSDSVSKLKW